MFLNLKVCYFLVFCAWILICNGENIHPDSTDIPASEKNKPSLNEKLQNQ